MFLALGIGMNVVATLSRGVLIAAGIVAADRHREAGAVLAAVAGILSLLTAVAVFWWEYHREPPKP